MISHGTSSNTLSTKSDSGSDSEWAGVESFSHHHDGRTRTDCPWMMGGRGDHFLIYIGSDRFIFLASLIRMGSEGKPRAGGVSRLPLSFTTVGVIIYEVIHKKKLLVDDGPRSPTVTSKDSRHKIRVGTTRRENPSHMRIETASGSLDTGITQLSGILIVVVAASSYRRKYYLNVI